MSNKYFFIPVSFLVSLSTYAYDGIFAKGEVKYNIDPPKVFCRPASNMTNRGTIHEEMLQLIFPQMPNQSSLKHALPFTVDRMHYLLDGLTIATDVNGDNCKDSDPSSNGSDLRTVYDSTKQYTVTEHVFALYTQENKNCAISYRVYRSLDAKFWTLNVNLKEKKGLSAIVDVGSLKETDCQTIAIDDNPVQKLLAKELKASFIKNKMQPETQEKY